MHITDKLYEKKWGVFNHYTPHIFKAKSSEAWIECVNKFDVKKLAEQLYEMGAGYYFITVVHGTKYMLLPNETYNNLMGVEPGVLCPERDLALELYDELSKYGIDLYLYYNASGIFRPKEDAEKLGFWTDDDNIWTPNKGVVPYNWKDRVVMEDGVEIDFIKKWSKVLREYSLRYKDKVCGWWIDSCYDFVGFNQENIKYFYDAAKAGNPDALVACNNGVMDKTNRWYKDEEFVAGEFNELEYVPTSRFENGAQNHILAPMGNSWWQSEARYDNDYMKNYIRKVNQNGGVVTVDIHVNEDGSFVKEQMDSLMLRDL